MRDADGDGFSEAMGDCNDNDPLIHPSTNEIPYNARDDDCNAATPDDDLDRDGYRQADDCNDAAPAINPGVREIFYNEIDDDCDPTTRDKDIDGDGFRAQDYGGDDCNDLVSTVNPGAQEIPYNGLDDDCNLSTADDDLDGDGIGFIEDCDDTNPEVSPSMVENNRDNCGDGIDNNCRAGDTICAESVNDGDGDGVVDDDDCEPVNPNIPGLFEVIGNGLDDDCNPNTPDLPSQCLDDEFDQRDNNRNVRRASLLAPGATRREQYADLILCPYDEDWYFVEPANGDGLEVDIGLSLAGNLDLQLLRIGSDGLLGDLSDVRSMRRMRRYRFVAMAGGRRYFLRVYKAVPIAQPTPYTLTYHAFESCLDDVPGVGAEQNDRFLQAVPFPPNGERRQICQYDDDWYVFDVEEEAQTQIHLMFDHSDGDLDLELYDEMGDRLSASVTISDNEVIAFELPLGRYYARVYGYDSATNDYVIVNTIVPTRSGRAHLEAARDLRDYRRGLVGMTRIELPFDAPDGSFIRQLTVRDLVVEHSFLNDLKITAAGMECRLRSVESRRALRP